MSKDYQDLILALNMALDGDWDSSHKIVQNMDLDVAKWIHAVLHKIEGDESNSKYWYTLCKLGSFEDYDNPNDELLHIIEHVNKLSFPE
ncbi:hypothetical protein OAP73_05730 [Methylophilaceae bacterium]|nr:hypothetical protein [Methylophilaceae bacterium]